MARSDDIPAVLETKLVHDVHRHATSMLADAVAADEIDRDAVRELRDFVVATLVHHHSCEDHDLWTMLRAAAPDLDDPLSTLTREHEQLDSYLDALGEVRVDSRPDEVLRSAAAAVRDLVHRHLANEEPVLFPAMRAHVNDAMWSDFSARTVASVPPETTDLLVAMFTDIGPPEVVELIFRHVPPTAREMVPSRLRRATETLTALRSA